MLLQFINKKIIMLNIYFFTLMFYLIFLYCN